MCDWRNLTHLQDISHIDAECVLLRGCWYPSPLVQHLETANIVLVQDGEEVSIHVRLKAKHLLRYT